MRTIMVKKTTIKHQRSREMIDHKHDFREIKNNNNKYNNNNNNCYYR